MRTIRIGLTGRVAKAVIDHLEAVEIQEQHGKQVTLIAVPASERALQPIQEQRAIRQTREHVVVRVMDQPLLGPFAIADVVNDALETDQVAVGQLPRRNGQQAPQHQAIGPAQSHLEIVY